MSKIDKLNQVRFARKIIKSDLFTEEQITQICGWLGFNDTAFRDKSAKDKLKDYLLDEIYWIKRL